MVYCVHNDQIAHIPFKRFIIKRLMMRGRREFVLNTNKHFVYSFILL